MPTFLEAIMLTIWAPKLSCTRMERIHSLRIRRKTILKKYSELEKSKSLLTSSQIGYITALWERWFLSTHVSWQPKYVNLFLLDCPAISQHSRKLLEKERFKYVKILLHYLHEKYGIFEGNRKFMESLSLINSLFKTKRNYTDTYHTFKHYFKIGRPDPMLLFDLLNINDSVWKIIAILVYFC